MATIILQTEVQARIDALTYPIEATVLLQNAVDTVGLGLDLTNIIAVLDSSTSAITSGTPEDDVTALNAASLALGVTTKPDAGGSSGGGGIPINGVIPLNVTEDKMESEGITWLKSGIAETDFVSYPDAARNIIISADYSGVNFDVSSQASSPMGICWDGTNFWVLDFSSDSVYQYTSAGTYTGINFSVVNEEGNPRGICWDGLHLWVVGSSSRSAFQYTLEGVYTGESFSVSAQESLPNGICWTGDNFWVIGADEEAYQYSASGVYVGVSFSVSANIVNPSGICWVNARFWIIGWTNKIAYEYTESGVYTGNSFDMSAECYSPQGICWDGSDFWVVNNGTTGEENVIKYLPEKLIGISEQKIDTDTGLTIYVRIK